MQVIKILGKTGTYWLARERVGKARAGGSVWRYLVEHAAPRGMSMGRSRAALERLLEAPRGRQTSSG